MSLSFLRDMFRPLTAIVLLSFFAASLMAQDSQPQSQTSAPPPGSALPQAPPSSPATTAPARQFEVKDYSRPQRPFPNVIAPYTAQHVPPPDLSNTPRIDQLMREGKLYLSMDDAVALALENNLDIGISRY